MAAGCVMINGELLERRGWRKWQGQPIWMYGSARLIWCVKYGSVLSSGR